jgi:hypothetical protein
MELLAHVTGFEFAELFLALFVGVLTGLTIGCAVIKGIGPRGNAEVLEQGQTCHRRPQDRQPGRIPGASDSLD